MSSSPQVSASNQYLNRMHEEGYWNHRRRTGGVKSGPGPRGTVNQITAQEEALWSEAQREVQSAQFADFDEGITTATLWYCGSWKNEARDFFKLLQRGVSDVETVRADIAVNALEMADLNAWIAWKPNLESRIRRMVAYRAQMLDEFNRLVAENDAALTRSQTAAAD